MYHQRLREHIHQIRKVYHQQVIIIKQLETYQYKLFPRLNPKEFIKSRLVDTFVEEDAPVQTFKREDEVKCCVSIRN